MPTVTSISPTVAGPGELVTINGTNLYTATQVLFDSTPAKFTAQSPTQITAYVPAGSGKVGVYVVTPSGHSASSPAAVFTYGMVTSTAIFGNHCPTMWKSPLYPVRANTSGSWAVNLNATSTVAPGSTA